jgi:D-glycero-alpha-D-manno-heptose-7-phosphate kinase
MIITMTPLRVSFLGGGTDYPEHFSIHGGETLATSINKYTYITVTPLTEFFDHRIRISYAKTELCKDIEEIQHPSVRECMRFLKIDGGIEISIVSDLPARTGLGSSSCFTVGFLHALHGFKGEIVSHEQLAAEAVHVEREMIKERVGLQDQYICAHGGLSHLRFRGEKTATVSPLSITKERIGALEERLMMFYTGLQRFAHEILEDQIERTKAGTVTSNLLELGSLVKDGIEIISKGRDFGAFGEILDRGWAIKRTLSETVSNTFVDGIYERAKKAGAIGGKLLGAGGGGFLLLYVEPYNQPAVRNALSDLKEVKFSFENNGSRTIYYKPV